MILADAIEAWGQTHRERLTPAQLEKLGSVWLTVKRAEVGQRHVAELTRDDAAAVMVLFGEQDRVEIADLLNTVRKWTLKQPNATQPAPATSRAPAAEPVTAPIPGPAPQAPEGAEVAATQAMPIATAAPVADVPMPVDAAAIPWAGSQDPTPVPAATFPDPVTTPEPGPGRDHTDQRDHSDDRARGGVSPLVLIASIFLTAAVVALSFLAINRMNSTNTSEPSTTTPATQTDTTGTTTGTTGVGGTTVEPAVSGEERAPEDRVGTDPAAPADPAAGVAPTITDPTEVRDPEDRTTEEGVSPDAADQSVTDAAPVEPTEARDPASADRTDADADAGTTSDG